ncbi:MAG TPA: hypothetical protein DDZ38_05965, partial [Gammaproteobacteria bacterium]|nr:hypothetical protein [Gammaproteobacteria bacterium]
MHSKVQGIGGTKNVKALHRKMAVGIIYTVEIVNFRLGPLLLTQAAGALVLAVSLTRAGGVE